MSHLRIALCSFLVIVSASVGLVAMTPMPASAAPAKCSKNVRLFTFPAWYNGVVEADCTMGKIGNDGKSLLEVIVRIALNVVEIILQLVAYATIVFLIKGGFDYMTAAGDANKVANAKKTIEHALIGLVISLASVGIVNLVAGAV